MLKWLLGLKKCSHEYGPSQNNLHYFWRECTKCSHRIEYHAPCTWSLWKRYGITYQSRNCTICNKEEVI